MKLKDLLPAVELIRNRAPDHGSRAASYLRTYPDMVQLGTAPGNIDVSRLYRLALMTYGWMPRVLRLNPDYIPNAVLVLTRAQVATQQNWSTTAVITNVANCLYSLVGASKVLHFVNPNIFPIWDSKIEKYRQRKSLVYNHMAQLQNYESYVSEVHAITHEHEFNDFFTAANEALGVRLAALDIPRYKLTDIRAIEAAAFELASDV